jgi:hypothetical protein
MTVTMRCFIDTQVVHKWKEIAIIVMSIKEMLIIFCVDQVFTIRIEVISKIIRRNLYLRDFAAWLR